jgi:hypothetical protein
MFTSRETARSLAAWTFDPVVFTNRAPVYTEADFPTNVPTAREVHQAYGVTGCHTNCARSNGFRPLDIHVA